MTNFLPNKPSPKITSDSHPYQVIADMLVLRNDKRDLSAFAFNLKNTCDNELIGESMDRIHKLGTMDDVLWGNLFPRSAAKLGNGGNNYFFKPQSLICEINWIIEGLRPYKEQLWKFVSYRNSIERSILLGDYATASNSLEQLREDLGYSIWYYDMRFSIAAGDDDLGQCYSILTDFNNQQKSIEVFKGFASGLLQDLVNRNFYGKVSPYEFDGELLSRYRRTRSEFQDDLYNYFLFRLNFYQNFDIPNLSVVTVMEVLNALVDRYQQLIYLLKAYYVQEQNPLIHQGIIKLAIHLYRITKDSELLPFVILSGHSKNIPDIYFDTSFIEILDLYYTEHYHEAIDKCRAYLEANPSDADVIKIYCRSLIFLGKGYRPICHRPESLLNELGMLIYRVMTETDNTETLDNLYGLSKRTYSLHIAAGIDHFIKSEHHGENDTLNALSMSHYNPIFINIFGDDGSKDSYLNMGYAHFPDSISLRYQLARHRGDISHFNEIADYILEVDQAKLAFGHQDYDQSLALWQSILNKRGGNIPIAQTAIDYIFRSLTMKGVNFRQKAIVFYLNWYLKNKAAISKVETAPFMQTIRGDRFAGLRNGLDLILFCFLCAEKLPDKEFKLEQFCKYKKCKYPSQLAQYFNTKDPKEEKFFNILLDDDILYHFYTLPSTAAVLDEKVKIATHLRCLFPEKTEYSEKCTELMHELVAYRGKKSLDESKIYVNEEGIIKYEVPKMCGLYDRFRKQAELEKNGKVYLLVGTEGIDSTYTDVLKSVTTYSNDAIADVATKLFDAILNSFLKSNFGLGTYLSTRIRHGVFEGELRSVFIKKHIILEMSFGRYVPTDYWQKRYNISLEDNERLNACLKIFSDDVDSAIQSFKDNIIQIKHRNGSKTGAFDYDDITTKDICDNLRKINAYSDTIEQFVDGVIDWLWQLTEDKLAFIRNAVNGDFSTRLYGMLSTLERNTLMIDHDIFRREFKSQINHAREDLRNKLARIEMWFHRQKTKFEDFELTEHIKLAHKTVRDYLPEYKTELHLDNNAPKLQICAEYYPSMFDLFTIFFSNMFVHSMNEETKNLLVKVNYDKFRNLQIQFVNKLPPYIDEKAANKKFEELLKKESLLQKEGGSGLVKANNIVKYELQNVENGFTIQAKDGLCIVDIHVNMTNLLVK